MSDSGSLDAVDLFLLRIGFVFDDGAMCDDAPETQTQADILDRCEAMLKAGLMVRSEEAGRIRHYFTTPHGLAAHGPFGNVTGAVN